MPRRWLVALGAVLLAGVVAVGFLPWEWSFIDDGNLITRTQLARTVNGPVSGTLGYIVDGWHYDLSWGLFRPVFWVFIPFFYLLPVGAAHALRAAMLVTAVAGAMVAVSRGHQGPQRLVPVFWAGLAVLADTSIFAGVYYPSTQELTGLSLLGLGLFARRRPALRLVAWLCAAWFKAPFAWLLLAYGLLLLWRRRDRVLGLAYTVLGAGTLAVLALAARTGSYSQGNLSFTWQVFRLNLTKAAGLAGPAVIVLLVGALLLGARFSLGGLRRPGRDDPPGPDPLAAALLLGGLGYLANLIFWRTGSYYASGFIYPLTVGTLLAVRQVAPLSRVRLAAALAVPALVAAPTIRTGLRDTWQHNQQVVGLRDCVLGLPGAPVIGYNRGEAWQRLDFVAHQAEPDWPGRVVRVANGATVSTGGEPDVSRFDYFIWEPGSGPGTPSLMTGPVVCTAPYTKVYQVVN